jgi:restriction system protein
MDVKNRVINQNEELEQLRKFTHKNELRYIHHRDFEYFVAKFLTVVKNYPSYVTQAAKDGGKDIIAYDEDGEPIYVEVKHWKGNVGRPAIQKLNGAMIADHVHRGYFVTSSGFTKEAREYADKTNITLIDGDTLIKQMHT